MSALAQGQTTIPAGTWQHDPVHSSIGFAVKHNTVMTFNGQFGEWEATLADGRLEGSANVSSVRVEDENLVGHLQTPDFFDAEQHPKLRFVSSSIERDGETVSVSGDLTLRGQTHPVELAGTVVGPIEDAYGKQRIGFDLETTVNRRDYGLNWSQDLPSGEPMLADDVVITANLSLIQS